MIKIRETIKYIRATCDNYVDPDLVATVVHDNYYYMGSNNIEDLDKFDIKKEDSFEDLIDEVKNMLENEKDKGNIKDFNSNKDMDV